MCEKAPQIEGLFPSSLFIRGRGVPESVQLPGPGKFIDKGHDGPSDPQQSVTGLRIGDIAHLGFRDVQQLGQLRPVGGRLVQQHQKLTVGEHEPGRLRAQALLHILRGGGQGRAILAKAFPRLVEELGGIVVFEEQVG